MPFLRALSLTAPPDVLFVGTSCYSAVRKGGMRRMCCGYVQSIGVGGWGEIGCRTRAQDNAGSCSGVRQRLGIFANFF